ncbi:hypothetical protein CHLRE_18g748647v5 [Chlamydomonas reinhardtii]|uniref:Uncharacterized protein n=1 Tax=Chlamydomonas reinhardtii TaxID=3055 RepID=A0A2K3CNH6_CHLRE|nr:uncharacterized protein CHLRE_18g748647v5 [Chlamydomonas reinhardtii]PNW69837.1 hypothetical protein CHLRE_18g748647v5 [Chlamydomonas reinhardtii]
MQLDDVATRRADLHEDYERAAQGLPPRAVVRRVDLPAAAAATLGAIRDTLARLWQVVRWERRHFETLWRLAIDAVPLPGNSHMPLARREPCGCGQHGHGGAAAGHTQRSAHATAAPLLGLRGGEGRAGADQRTQPRSGSYQPSPAVAGPGAAGFSAVCLGRGGDGGAGRHRTWPGAAARDDARRSGLGLQTAGAAAPEAAVAHHFWSRLMQLAQLGVPQKG